MNQLQPHAATLCDISTLKGPFELPPLPYSIDALEPYISEETLQYHHGKHHANYVKKTNELLANLEIKNRTLEEIIRCSDGPLFNNASQHWNHTFFWNCLSPKARPHPEGPLLSAIKRAFHSFEEFKRDFTTKATDLFGSGYVWLIQNPSGTLELDCFSNAHNPVTKNLENPVLCLDVWEHAYYVDYRNDRKRFIENFWKVVNWDFAEANFRTH